MPIQVVGPDGQQLEFPDGTDREIMRAAMQKRYGGAPAQAPAEQPTEQPGYWAQRTKEIKDFGNGIRYNIADTSLGLGQMVASGLDAIAPREKTTADLISGQDNSRRAEIDAQVRKFRADRDAQAAQGGEFFAGGDYVGTGLQTLAPTGKIAQGGKAAYGLAALSGGLYGASQSTLDDESRIKNALVGSAANVAGLGVANGLMAAAKPVARGLKDLYSTAKDRGIDLTFAQVSNSEPVKRMAHLADRLPFSGAAKRQEQQVAAFNKAVAKEIGAKPNAENVIDFDVMARRYEKFNKQFDQVFSGGTKIDNKFTRDVGEVWRDASELDATAQSTVSNFIRRLEEQGADGEISGATLKSLDQSLRKAATGGGDRQQVAEALRDMLHDNFGRNAPTGLKQQWDTIRKQYRSYKTIEPIVAENPLGPLPPTRLRSAVARDKSGKARLARGAAGDLGDLSIIGQRMQGPRTSGSPEGIQQGAIGVGLWANPVSTLGLLASGNVAGRALNSSALARLAMSDRRRILAPLAPYARPLPLLLSRTANANEPEGP